LYTTHMLQIQFKHLIMSKKKVVHHFLKWICMVNRVHSASHSLLLLDDAL
jgi:hypothetical protein